ncbi:MAG: hypothetical protein ACM3SU_02630 [Acidobacteriota bacterium]
MNTILLFALPLWALLAGPAPTPPPTLTLRDGRVYQLREPARTEGGRVVFTTVEGKTYSLDPSEVKSMVLSPPTPTRVPREYNPQDSRALGAIAREQRATTGKTTDLSAPHPTPRPSARPTKRHAPKTPSAVPRRPTPAHAAKTPSPARAARTPSPAPR